LLLLAGLAQAARDLARADALVVAASRLRPADPRVQLDVGNYWLDRGEPALAIQHWSTAAQADATFEAQVFSRLRGLLGSPEGRAAMAELAADPPQWWHRFFADTARSTHDVALLRSLYALRRAATETPLTTSERRIYLERMRNEGRFEDAYLAWVNSLSDDQLGALGYLYNGGFDEELTGIGFDWQLSDEGGVRAARTAVDVGGRVALVLRFRGLRTPYAGLWQPLFLTPGEYQFGGSVRGDGFYTAAGLRWVARCVAPEPMRLGESERLFGTEQWTSLRFSFQVPTDCVYQEVRLVSAGDPNLDQTTDGELWFDDLFIRRLGSGS
jgi:hypothetical protein